MGFWHTGYIEFHEPVGYDSSFKPLPPRFPCAHCMEVFSSQEELRKHRFEAHPLRRPAMFLHGRELGTHPLRITRQLSPNDVRIEECDHAILNGSDISLSNLPQAVAEISSEICRVVLIKSGVNAEFELDIRVASEGDLDGIENAFRRTAQGGRLDTRAIEEFIAATLEFCSAIGYCDGICSYLYGILAKERAGDSSLPYEAYIGKFTKAADALRAYDRPLANTIGSLIEFHFNHFRESSSLSPGSRLASVADRYAAWLENRDHVPATIHGIKRWVSSLETLVTDWESEQIIRLSVRPLDVLLKDVGDIEAFLNRDLAEYDRVKLHVLLGEIYAASGDMGSALTHAKTLRNIPALERWAESLIQTFS